MELFIDTTNNLKVKIFLKKEGTTIALREFEARFSQAEKLLPQIKKMLLEKTVKLGDLSQIRVNSKGASFTSLRVGIVTANALAFALGIPVKNFTELSEKHQGIELVRPEYDRDPDITLPKKKNLK